jgi:hypothetical protein
MDCHLLMLLWWQLLLLHLKKIIVACHITVILEGRRHREQLTSFGK